jgi:hypothetical protein
MKDKPRIQKMRTAKKDSKRTDRAKRRTEEYARKRQAKRTDLRTFQPRGMGDA